jgi:hypothetical protein
VGRAGVQRVAAAARHDLPAPGVDRRADVGVA